MGSRAPSHAGSRASAGSKADYRPLRSSQASRSTQPLRSRASRPSRRQDRPTDHPVLGLEAIAEGPTTAGSEESTSLPKSRDEYDLPRDPSLRSAVTTLNHYLERTGLDESFKSLCALLLGLTDLPYNPYPGFVRRLGAMAARFHMDLKSEEEILQVLGGGVEETHIAYITRPPACDFAWGLATVICAISPVRLRQYKWLLHDLTPDPSRLNSPLEEYSVQVMTALVGSSVFHGTFIPHPPSLDVRLEFLITGVDVTEGIKLFVDSVLEDIRQTEKNGRHALLGVRIPLVNDKTVLSGGGPEDLWQLDVIFDRKEEFWQAVHDTVTANMLITAEYMFCLAADVEIYHRGQKQYGLNFVQVAEDMQEEESLSSFTHFPLSTLHEGIFMSRTHAEAYLGTFTPRDDVLDKNEQKARSFQSGLLDQENVTSVPGTPGSQVSSNKMPSRKHSKVRIDGFRLGTLEAYGPDSWEVTAPIKSHLQRHVVSTHLQENLMDVVFSVIKMVLMDRVSYGDDLLVELYRAAHSTAAYFHSLRLLNQSLRDLVIKYEGNAVSKLVTEVYSQFRQGLQDLFNSKMQDHGSHLVTAAKAIDQRLEALTMSQEGFSQSLPLTRGTTEELLEIDAYCSAVSIGLAENTLANCPKLMELIRTLQDTFPEDIHRPQTQSRDRREHRRTSVRAGEGEILYRHGAENDLILKHDRQVINVEMCEERNSAPSVVATENVLIKYIMDTHLDEIWPQFLQDLISGTHLPPNPFSHAVSFFRQCAMKMDLCMEAEEKIRARVLHGGTREEDPANYIWHIPGCDAHGHQSALMAVDSGQYFKVAAAVQQLIQLDFIQRRGPYRVAICSALAGHSSLYGEMAPYVTTLELHEHCYIRGPDGCALEGLQIYSKVVYEHIKGLKRSYPLPVSGIYFGDAQTRWSVAEVVLRKRAFASEFERHISNKEPVVIKTFVQLDWRYVPVVKHFKYHFINEDETVMEEFFTTDPAALYMNVFFSVEKAAFHFQYGGTSNRSNPYNSSNLRTARHYIDRQVLTASRKQDWLSVHRWLLTRDLIHQGSTHVAECWKMLHSIAGQAEYAIALGNSLKELIMYASDLDEKPVGGPGEGVGVQPETKSTDQDHLGYMDLSILAQMTMAYRQKVESVCNQQVALAGRTIGDVIQARLQSIMERDQVTRELYLKLEPRTISIMTEVHNMLQFIQDSTSYDVHCTCPAAQTTLQSIHAEFCDRPSSVASVRLDDPSEYELHPVLRMPDHVEEWIRS